MKKVLIVSLVLSVFTLTFSILMSIAAPLKPDSKTAESPAPASGSSSPAVSTVPDAEYAFEDDHVTVRVLTDGKVTPMTMGQYLIGVVAAEMPATFNIEALEAQAVAARTETLYHVLLYKSTVHPDADVCSDPSDCQAYTDDNGLHEKWGNAYSSYIEKITKAVQNTDGVCLTYQNAPIQAVFHSSSAGMTANSGEVWANSLPYLVSVKSPESSADVPNYVSSVTVSLSDFKATVLQHYPNAVFPKDRNKWITAITHTDSGRIDTLKLGGVSVTGPILRGMFGLRSTAASIAIDSKNVTFTTTGYGHGVGMSQYGANALALEGKNYKEILTWYYTGISFSSEKDLIKS
jgi:stage II sporulation protein D